MKLLGWWLMLVGTLRLASVWFGFFDIWALRLAVYSKATKQLGSEITEGRLYTDLKTMWILVSFPYILPTIVGIWEKIAQLHFRTIAFRSFDHLFYGIVVTEVHGRTFGVWTLLTCTLCYLCAFNLDNKPLYLATFLSFIYAFGHFLSEYLIYHTMAIGNLTTVGIFAGTSIILMLLQWNSHQPVKAKPQ